MRENYTFPVPKMGRYEEAFSTDPYSFGGKNVLNPEAVRTVIGTDENGERMCTCSITLPALGGVIYRKESGS